MSAGDRGSKLATSEVEYYAKILDLPAEERPREKLLHRGEAVLNNTELIAILLRTGIEGENALDIAARLLNRYRGLVGLAQAGVSELAQERGLGAAKATQIKAALELGRRLVASSPESMPQIRCPADAVNLIQAEMSLLEQEHVRALLLDSRNRVTGNHTISVGSLNANHLRVADLFRPAIKANSAAIIVAHNHPSGDPTPSPEDVQITRQIVEAGKLIDIDVLDHLIIGRQRFVSLKEKGLGFA